jgi:Amt family ammonium transporter
MVRLLNLRKWAVITAAAAAIAAPSAALAQEGGLDSGDTAWILTSTALVLFMTLPGLALFYGGLVRAQNVLSVLMHVFAIACVASIVWFVAGYSLAFADGGGMNPFVGGLGKAFLAGIGTDDLSGTLPESVFFMFQMTFAIITPALIVGAYVERMKFSAVIVFSTLWLIFVYSPVTHWIWGGGWLAEMGVLDFAGGLVVHTTAGVSALVIAVVLGGRTGFPTDIKRPHNPGMTMIGAAMLWVGWFGFNAGSALAAGGGAGMAMTVTHISAAAASLTWMVVEWWRHGKPTLIGTVTGFRLCRPDGRPDHWHRRRPNLLRQRSCGEAGLEGRRFSGRLRGPRGRRHVGNSDGLVLGPGNLPRLGPNGGVQRSQALWRSDHRHRFGGNLVGVNQLRAIKSDPGGCRSSGHPRGRN